MIRIVLGLFAFAVILCAWIIVQPFGGAPDDGRPVAAIVPDAVPDALSGADVDVTRAADPDAVPVPAPPARIATDADDLQGMTAGVLAGLGLQVAAPVTASDDMRTMTASILDDIRAATGRPAATPQTALQGLIVQALREGRTDAYIDTLLNEAAREGRVTVPGALVTTEGRVDTSVLLASIVDEARIATGGAARSAPATDEGANGDTTQDRVYTVGPGDSLGAIAVRFYGSVSHYPAIFDANRAQLASADKVRAGQRLIIPAIADP